MGHEVLFVGTERGVENQWCRRPGFAWKRFAWVGLKISGHDARFVSAWRLIAETLGQIARSAQWKPAAVFSMGGYVAGPPVLAALVRGVPLVVMEPNAVPGFTNRISRRWVSGRSELRRNGAILPAGQDRTDRAAGEAGVFRYSAAKPKAAEFTVSDHRRQPGIADSERSCARRVAAVSRSRAAGSVHSSDGHGRCTNNSRAEFAKTGLAGEVTPFISDMPARVRASRSGGVPLGSRHRFRTRGGGKTIGSDSLPFRGRSAPAEKRRGFRRAGAARALADGEWTGEKFFEVVRGAGQRSDRLDAMGEAAKKLAHQGAARRAAEILVESTEVEH